MSSILEHQKPRDAHRLVTTQSILILTDTVICSAQLPTKAAVVFSLPQIFTGGVTNHVCCLVGKSAVAGATLVSLLPEEYPSSHCLSISQIVSFKKSLHLNN